LKLETPFDRKDKRTILRNMKIKQMEKEALLAGLGARVRALRLEADLTVSAFGKRTSLSPRFINQLEAGTGNISVARLAQVAAALGRALPELLPPSETDHSLRAEVWRSLAACDDEDLSELRQWLAKRNRRRAMPRYIALIGILGAGKSTVGPLLARRLKTDFVELDHEIEEAAGMPLADLFATHGEHYYRAREREALAQLFATSGGGVFAPGGSVVTDPESWNLVKQRCFTIWLHATPEELMKRTKRKGNPRLLSRPSVMTDLKSLLARREPLYAESQLTIKTTGKTPAKIAQEILNVIHSLRQEPK
jgi:XRE family transcriptional regulator, aerobic/anaerobic benzoate catabolism transcriptional regulator